MGVVELYLDNNKYFISTGTLKKYNNLELSKVVLNNFKSEYFKYNGSKVCVFLKKESFEIILDFLRGYPIDQQNSFLKYAKFDARRINFMELYNKLNSLLIESIKHNKLQRRISSRNSSEEVYSDVIGIF
jgi:hypothetical protein